MGTRPRYRAVTPADLGQLPGVPALDDELWPRASMRQYGLCGLAERVGEGLPSHVLVAPSLHLPAAHPRAGAGDRDTAVVMLLHPAGGPRASQCARVLLHALAGRLPVRRIDALAERAGGEPGPGLLPVAWLDRAGFRPLTAGPTAAVWRLDLSTALRWRQLARGALHGLEGLRMPAPVAAPPEPAARAHDVA